VIVTAGLSPTGNAIRLRVIAHSDQFTALSGYLDPVAKLDFHSTFHLTLDMKRTPTSETMGSLDVPHVPAFTGQAATLAIPDSCTTRSFVVGFPKIESIAADVATEVDNITIHDFGK